MSAVLQAYEGRWSHRPCELLGRWNLTGSDEQREGNFSLVFRQIDGRWQIVQDHTSIVREED